MEGRTSSSHASDPGFCWKRQILSGFCHHYRPSPQVKASSYLVVWVTWTCIPFRLDEGQTCLLAPQKGFELTAASKYKTRKGKVKSLSCVRLFATPWTVAYEAPPSMEFFRQEYWSGLPFPSPGDFPIPGIEPGSPALQADASPSESPRKWSGSPGLNLDFPAAWRRFYSQSYKHPYYLCDPFPYLPKEDN